MGCSVLVCELGVGLLLLAAVGFGERWLEVGLGGLRMLGVVRIELRSRGLKCLALLLLSPELGLHK